MPQEASETVMLYQTTTKKLNCMTLIILKVRIEIHSWMYGKTGKKNERIVHNHNSKESQTGVLTY